MDTSIPENRLRQFMSEMNSWEIWAKQNDPKEPTEDEWRAFWGQCQARLDSIFDKFCTSRKRGYRRHCDYRDPPEYQPELEPTVEVIPLSPEKVEIITQERSGFENRNKYTLVNKQGIWLLDKKMWFDDVEDMWQIDVL